MKLETLYNHPYKVILTFILIFFSFMALQGLYFLWWTDAEIYLNIAQVLFHDGILYKDAIDTKNIGFLFFWYFMYFPYATLFDTMQFFPIWHGLVLSSLYFGIGALSYTIANQLYDNKLSLLSTLAILFIIFGNRHSLFINQPQVAVLFILFFLLYLHKTFTTQNYLNFFIYGILLAVAFSFAHILAPLVLIVPFLVIQKDIIIDKKHLIAFYKCILAGLGFFCIIGVFFAYLYYNNALNDWLYWNTVYPLTIYTKSSLSSILLIFLSLFGIGNNLILPLSYSILPHYFFLISCIVSFFVFIYKKCVIKQNFNITPIEYALMFFGLLSIISRFLISRLVGSAPDNFLPFIEENYQLVLENTYIKKDMVSSWNLPK